MINITIITPISFYAILSVNQPGASSRDISKEKTKYLEASFGKFKSQLSSKMK